MQVLQYEQKWTHAKGGQHVFLHHRKIKNFQKSLLIADNQYETHLKSHI